MLLGFRTNPLFRLALLAGGYGLAAWCSVAWLGSPSHAPEAWFPAGVASAAVLLLGWRALPGLVLGGLLVGWLGIGGDLAGPLPAGLNAAVMALVVPRLVRSKDVFSSASNLLMFLVAAGLGGLALAPLLGSQPLQAVRALLIGHLLVGPWLASCFRPHSRQAWRTSVSWESAGALVSLGVLGGLIASRVTPVLAHVPGFTLLPVLIWASFRLPPPAATSVHVLAGLMLGAMTPLEAGGANPALHWESLRLAAGTVLMSQLVLAVAQERRRMHRHLTRNASRLQRLVRLRTQELAEANKRLQELSESDGLTGVANRRHFDQVFEQEWRRALRRGEPLTLGLIDVDHFKAYNDHYGHLLGDEALQRVAASLKGVAARAEDLVARYGGEEFAVILPGLHRQEANLMAERLRAAVEHLAIPHERGGQEQLITVSGGLVALVPHANCGREDLLNAADQLLYAAKTRGRNRVLVQAMALDGDVTAAAS